jgi:tRNA (pseudouridine54-N1)-methyltransferase
MHAFVVVGELATADGEFQLDNLPSSSGRLDVLLRCVRAALLTSHGLRRDTAIYLVLQAGPAAPRVVRIRGDTARFIRPDERALAVLFKKVLGAARDRVAEGFVEIKPGIAVARGGLELALSERAGSALYWLDESGADIRGETGLSEVKETTFVLGDHRGLTQQARASLTEWGARALCLGPTSVHSDDAVAIVNNELDRRLARALDAER